jgi:hypothetical protein
MIKICFTDNYSIKLIFESESMKKCEIITFYLFNLKFKKIFKRLLKEIKISFSQLSQIKFC